ncbi:MAG: 50S ribosomal protein L11 methyltransferase [Thermoleophilia bacterium]|nr:50S ribosomal protein L11 methyltransferase [Thermoleophilia bacterium]
MSGAGRLRRAAIRVDARDAEEARALLLALCPAGFEELELPGRVELAAYVDAAGEARLTRAFPQAAGSNVPEGWEDAWRAFHRPVRAGPLWIGPPWERPDPGALAVVIDPGQAFGTGAHATTRLCLELLAEQGRGSLLDLGCGSGVLAIAAVRLGFGPVVALDDDPAAVEAARANARANGVDVQIRLADCLREPLPDTAVAVANIGATAVSPLASRVPAPRLIASGYLAADRIETPGRRSVERRELDEWAADVLERPAARRRS